MPNLPLEDNYIRLVGKVIRKGLEKDGPNYLRTDGGRFWCGLGGLDPKIVWEQVEKRRQRNEALYPEEEEEDE